MDIYYLLREVENKINIEYIKGKQHGVEFSYREDIYLECIHRLKETTVSEIAKTMGISKSAVTQYLKILLAKGYVVKVEDKLDKRKAIIKLSEKIAKVYEDDDLLLSNIVKEKFKVLSETEQELFKNLILKLIKAK